MVDNPDDLEAIRTIVKTLQGFEMADQERILRWVREKLGLAAQGASAPGGAPAPPRSGASLSHAPEGPKDIKTFVAEKNPTSNNELAAAVAYYHRFVASDSTRKDSITADDLQEACRLTGRTRLSNPAQTLVHAHNAGLLDKAGDRGAYSISTVGENLVAVTLPSGTTSPRPRTSVKRKRAKGKTKKAVRRAPGSSFEARKTRKS